jgi:hypothetical protein
MCKVVAIVGLFELLSRIVNAADENARRLERSMPPGAEIHDASKF